MPESTAPDRREAPTPRPWKGVLFHCCGVYGRMYKSVVSGLFEGNCPKCGRPSKLSLLSLVIAFICSVALLTSTSVYAQDLTSTHSPNLRDSLVPLPPEGLTPQDSSPTLLDSTLKVQQKPPRDSVTLAFFAQTGVAFLGFDDRNRFEYALDSLFQEYRSLAATAKDSALVKKQLLQKVNFSFPVFAGFNVMVTQNNHLACGVGYIYDREAAIVIDHNSVPHEFFYTLQAVPMFLEWRIGISPRLISLDSRERFSAIVRWWWLLSGTEIYSSSGILKHAPQFQGDGWSISLGYQILEWKRLRLFGDLGYSSLTAKSRSSWSQVVSETDSTSNPDHASWGLGGVQLNLRASLGLLKR